MSMGSEDLIHILYTKFYFKRIVWIQFYDNLDFYPIECLLTLSLPKNQDGYNIVLIKEKNS